MRVCLFRHSREKRRKAIPARSDVPKPAPDAARRRGPTPPGRPVHDPSATIGRNPAHSGPSHAWATRTGTHGRRRRRRRERPAAVRAAARADGLRRLRPGVPQRGAAGRDRRRAAARVRQQRADPLPRPADGAQRLPRRAVAAPTSTGSRRTTPRWPRSSPRSSRSTPSSRATSSPGRSPSASRRPTTSPPAGSGSAARPQAAVHRATPPHTQVRRARALSSRSTAPGTRSQPPGLVVGRGTEADLRINDPGVSRRHVEFVVDDAGDGGVGIEVRDLGSTNGMLVDGHRDHPAPRVQRRHPRSGSATPR